MKTLMTLEQVRDWHRKQAYACGLLQSRQDVHLAQPAQAVDVGAIREVIARVAADNQRSALTLGVEGLRGQCIATAKELHKLTVALPKDVQVAMGAHDIYHGDAGSWKTIRAHLLSQDAEIARLQREVEHNIQLRHMQKTESNHIESRLAAADALLRSIAAYAPPEHECVHGCTVTMCEACKLADYLRGPIQ